MKLSKIGKVMVRIRENGIRSEQDLRTQVTKRMQHYLRSSMHLTKGKDFSLRSRKRVMVGSLYNVGLAAKIIAGEIVHNIRVVDRKSTVLRRHKQWETLDKVFLRFM